MTPKRDIEERMAVAIGTAAVLAVGVTVLVELRDMLDARLEGIQSKLGGLTAAVHTLAERLDKRLEGARLWGAE